ncbi:hypothetical protein WG925_27820, partial [Pseudonocardia carboxydivorans]
PAALHDRQHAAGRVRTELLRSPTRPRHTDLGRTQPPLNPGRFKHLRGSALGFRNLTNYIARSLLETGGFRPQLLHPRLG